MDSITTTFASRSNHDTFMNTNSSNTKRRSVVRRTHSPKNTVSQKKVGKGNSFVSLFAYEYIVG